MLVKIDFSRHGFSFSKHVRASRHVFRHWPVPPARPLLTPAWNPRRRPGRQNDRTPGDRRDPLSSADFWYTPSSVYWSTPVITAVVSREDLAPVSIPSDQPQTRKYTTEIMQTCTRHTLQSSVTASSLRVREFYSGSNDTIRDAILTCARKPT